MKKIIAVILTCVLLLVAALSNAETRRFADTETGVSFIILDGWVEVPNSDGNKAIKAQYTAGNHEGQTTIAFAALDLYSAMGLSEAGVARKDIDFSFLDDELVSSMLGPLEAKTKEVKRYGDYQYRVITCSMERPQAGMNIIFDCEMAVTMVNGYVLLFQYMALSNFAEDIPVFESLLESVQISGFGGKESWR